MSWQFWVMFGLATLCAIEFGVIMALLQARSEGR